VDPAPLNPRPASTRTILYLVRGNPINQLLLGYKKTGFGQGKYTGIGGKVEPGESIAAAALRELEEETGVRGDLADLVHAGRLDFRFPHRPQWSQVDHVYLLHHWEGQPVEGREVRPEWYRPAEIPYERMWQDARHWLPLVLAGKPVDLVFIFDQDNETVAQVLPAGITA
jgi:8-oxo-dGTP diphosphatase